MENLRNKVSVQLVNNKKDYLRCTSKPSYMSHKIFDNNLVAIRKSKLPLKLNKPVYNILELSKVLMNFNINTNLIMITLKGNMTTNQNYYSQTLIV